MLRHRFLPTAAGVLAAIAVAAPAHADVPPVAGLSSTAPVAADFLSVAVSGATVVAGGNVTDVWTEPASGWTSGPPAAVLTDPTFTDFNLQSQGVSISGNTVAETLEQFASLSQASTDVFVEPAGGWSGDVTPAARLADTTSSGPFLDDATIAGGAIAAYALTTDDFSDFLPQTSTVDVFTEPGPGWAGTVTPTAQLSLPADVHPADEPAFTGSAVFVPTPHATYVFQEPVGGWSGTLTPSATLDAGGQVSASGQMAFVAGEVFSMPAGGWSGAVHPSGAIFPHQLPNRSLDLPAQIWSGVLTPDHAVTSHTTIASGEGCGSPTNGCPTTFRVASEPSGGWSGARLSDAVVHVTADELSDAADDQDLFVASLNEVSVYPLAQTAGTELPPPARQPARVTGLLTGAPAIELGLRSATGQPPITKLQLTLPAGLRFATAPGRLASGVQLSGATTRRTIDGGRLTLTNPQRRQRLAITVGHQALSISPRLTRRLRSLAAHHGHTTLTITATATDQAGATFTVRFRPRIG
jgi:hypothetical protein